VAQVWSWVGRAILNRGKAVAVVVALATVVLAAGATRLQFETSQASLLDEASEVYQLNLRYQDAFGGEPMLVLFTGPVEDLVRPENLAILTDLEDELRATGRFPAVLGPATALGFARDQLGVAPELILAASAREQAAAPDEEARAAVEARWSGSTPSTPTPRASAAGGSSPRTSRWRPGSSPRPSRSAARWSPTAMPT